jgi:hypothetical protein
MEFRVISAPNMPSQQQHKRFNDQNEYIDFKRNPVYGMEFVMSGNKCKSYSTYDGLII